MNLKEHTADQEEKERLRWEEEARQAEEEESNLLAATKLDMEMLSQRVIVGGTKIVDKSAAHITAAARGGDGVHICVGVGSDGTRIQEGGQGDEAIAASEMAVQQLQQDIADMTLTEEEAKEEMDKLHYES